jgi:glutaredoxin
MNPTVRRILEEFDRAGASVLERSGIEAFALRSGAGSGEKARSILDEMLRRGLLAEQGSPARLRRTESGRLALAGSLNLTLYTRAGCHLCEEMKAQLAPLMQEFGACLAEVDVDTDATLTALFGYDVPVLFLGDRKVAKHRLDARQLRRQMGRARVDKQRGQEQQGE